MSMHENGELDIAVLNLIKNTDFTAVKNLLLTQQLNGLTVYRYTFFAIKSGCTVKIIKILVNQLNRLFFSESNLTYETFGSASFDDRFTLIGLSIDHKHLDALKYLIEMGYCINTCYKKTNYSETNQGPVCVYLDSRHYRKGDCKLLRYMFSQNPVLDRIAYNHVFNLGVNTSLEEFTIIMDAGISINSKFKEESKTKNGDKTDIFYICEINLFDIVEMNAEIKNLLCDDTESIEKVRYMIKHGADVMTRNNNLDKNFLHSSTIPHLCKLFALKGVSVDHPAINVRCTKMPKCKPIEIAYDNVIIDILLQYGADKEDASYVRATKKYNSNLQRIRYNPSQTDKLFLVKCVNDYDIPSFISLIASGVDLNKTVAPDRWTTLHHIFSHVNQENVSENYNYISICTENVYLHFANILIKHKAKPLKDAVGRTPLMCMSFHVNNLGYACSVINQYIDYEATYYGLDRKEYKEKLLAFLFGDHKPVTSMIGMNHVLDARLKAVNTVFWDSFKKIKIVPNQAHDSVLSERKR
jgi:hypothetical protein